MSSVSRIINSIVAAVITTLTILTVSFLIMIFSSTGEGKSTTYFGSLFFNVSETDASTVKMIFGVENALPIIITVLLLSIVYFLIIKFSKKG